jgi:SAM-dependent methyltransferase
LTADGSLAASDAGETLEILREQRRAWERRPLVRRLYNGWFAEIESRLAAVPGPTIELGAGCGALKDYMPTVVATDVVETPWVDRVVDAQRLPFDDQSVANLVMVDVLHHVARPAPALQEAQRVLAPGGRVIMLEPYCSPVSLLVYRFLHHETADTHADPERPFPQSGPNPMDANIALPTLLFWRRDEVLRAWTPGLRLVERQRLAWLVYPLSGGFSKPPVLPDAVARPALAIERVLAPLLAPLAAFRCLIVLERA